MAIDDLKRWHWVVIGLVVGLALAYAQASGGNEPAGNLPSIGPRDFEEELRASPRDGSPVLDNVTVYPGPAGEPDLVVMLRRNDWRSWGPLGRGAPNARRIEYREHRIYLTKPFKPLVPVKGVRPGKSYTVRDYLRDLAKSGQAPGLNFRYAWWREPKTAFALWTFGSGALIGGVWPPVLNLLLGAGFGRRAPKDPDYDLDRFKSEPGTAKAPATAADMDAVAAHVRELEDELAHSLSGAAAVGPDAADAPKPPATLVTAPVEAGPAADDAAKEYQGEYYPVVKPHHEEPHPHPPPGRG